MQSKSIVDSHTECSNWSFEDGNRTHGRGQQANGFHIDGRLHMQGGWGQSSSCRYQPVSGRGTWGNADIPSISCFWAEASESAGDGWGDLYDPNCEIEESQEVEIDAKCSVPFSNRISDSQHKLSCKVEEFCTMCAIENHVKVVLVASGRKVSPAFWHGNLISHRGHLFQGSNRTPMSFCFSYLKACRKAASWKVSSSHEKGTLPLLHLWDKKLLSCLGGLNCHRVPCSFDRGDFQLTMASAGGLLCTRVLPSPLHPDKDWPCPVSSECPAVMRRTPFLCCLFAIRNCYHALAAQIAVEFHALSTAQIFNCQWQAQVAS
ncbi:hypothetical protein GOP47_0014666 [Adiantum capillus-veneris]|uniref:Uncharacterized protein n=1 Tax=Adiantum capillus-veneris TaxID=13818 RepID=A0A9D4UN37_ADICA|nr:hypothetical protein GOP47_0014666 [Adiantum capillus-veneris]